MNQLSQPASTLDRDTVFCTSLDALVSAYSANAQPGEAPSALMKRLLDAAAQRGQRAILATVFADPAWATEMPQYDFPISILAHHDTPRHDTRGARILAMKPGAYATTRDAQGRPIGAVWEDDAARYQLFGAMTPANRDASPAEQAREAWRSLKAATEKAGFVMTDLVRTWFYNDHILDWYDDFNRERTDFFNQNGIFDGLVPASTGVGACNAAKAALSLDALLVRPKAGAPRAVTIAAVDSPLQCPANNYKSAFSRAVKIETTANQYLSVSGTASIEPEGRTAHRDDLDAQIILSLRVVDAILKTAGTHWGQVARSILYFPKIEWMSRFDKCRQAAGLPPFPAIFAHCDICRDDLLFEIELDTRRA